MTDKKFLTMLKTRQKHIAAERDKLREMMGEIEDTEDVSQRAIEDIENAIDTLSEMV